MPQKKITKAPIKNPIQKYNNSLSEDQTTAMKVISESIITCLTGRFGTGKTHLAISYALNELAVSRYKSSKGIILTRPVVVERERNMGFLPGDLWEKMGPYLEPMIAIIEELEGKEKSDTLIKDGIINIAPLMAIQGRTFCNKICIVDEAQNLTRNDVEDLYSRIGIGSQMIFVGDINQCKLSKPSMSGFPRLCEISNESDNIGLANLTTNYRSPIVEEMMKLY